MFPFIVYLRRQLLRLCRDVDQSSRAAGKVVAVKSDNSGYEHVTLTKTSVGLSNVDNTSDVNKPISTATQTALNAKANKAGDTFTGPVSVQSASTTVPALTIEHSANSTQRLRNTAAGGADATIFCTNDSYSIGGSKVAWIITGQPSSNAFLTWALAANRLGVGNGNVSPTATLDVLGDTFRLRTSRTPASSTATGNAGDMCWDANYIYICTATNTWKRVAIATW